MSFELLPTVHGAGLPPSRRSPPSAWLLVAGLAVDFVVRNRPVRLRRNESIRRYYGHVSLSH